MEIEKIDGKKDREIMLNQQRERDRERQRDK